MVQFKKIVFSLSASKTASKNEGRKTKGKNKGLLRFYNKKEGKNENRR